VDGHPFNAHDLSGIWGNDGIAVPANRTTHTLDHTVVPPLTPYGMKLQEATQAPKNPLGFTASNAKDPELICDPLGYPRSLVYNYGMEFIQLPNRVLQFFEWGHTWRTIWTDGRKLPEDPPQQRFLGYAVGRWEGETFIVESNGFDDRSWLDQDRKTMTRGMPHSDEMRLVERYTRKDYGTLEVSLTIIDAKVYTQPWTTNGKFDLHPGTEIWEYFCVPSESNEYNERLTNKAVGAK